MMKRIHLNLIIKGDSYEKVYFDFYYNDTNLNRLHAKRKNGV